ncbi:oxidoreductase, NAD-binding domain protein [Paenibacillus sp. oral taxon 786 str. D14]|uniref:Gfo/Idh/MocA family protein n=1 Tax=Paenibacillus sp. oral taxon 786 TaxID=652715 RepID=UPI0001AFCF82|nr:Gfo/Idh/MocA family oxidoreductase [Paenibacillus sp. oral taxon 786]EES75218.1 oxidoreductase, NAD-binding domain protein [Paenibacillus sp. oral taxon 786 str. D14]
MRIGIIGLGDIAQKAYLPVITAREDVELVLSTRNQETLSKLAAKYRIPETVSSVDELVKSGVDAAFVHSATESHPAIVEQLIENGIHVYVDKPIAYHYEESKRLSELAEQKGVLLMTGFNRRFAPMNAALKEQPDRRLVLLQKNRTPSPDYARRFVLDDYIHVVDTLRFLAPGEVRNVHVSTRVQEGKLYHVTLQLEGDGFTCIGIMNRDSGANDEILEVMSPGQKWRVDGLNTTEHFAGGEAKRLTFKDWDPVLYRRGFVQIIDHFIRCVREGGEPAISLQDSLETHRLCEEIVKSAEANGAVAWERPL